MVRLNVLVKGDPDATLLEGLFSTLTDCSFQFYMGEGTASLAAVGRSVLFREGGPLMVVIDGETFSPRKAAKEREVALGMLHLISTAAHCDVFVFVPGLEVIFFETPGVLIRRFGADAVTESVIERGHYLPEDTLARILSPAGLSKEDFFQSLTSEELEELRKGPQASKLIAAVEKLAAAAARAERVALAPS
ncbi:MAG TPA: hypothetical protein VFF52_08435 [Isosphaeraceae bacterium]|nr:hypothetical protein [Isosphaeraceae bacterium]